MNDKDNNAFKYIFNFLIFLILGVTIGIYGATKYMNSHKVEDSNEEVVEESSVIDITEDSDYSDLISELDGFINSNKLFYSSKGVIFSDLAPELKLAIEYDYLIKNKLDVTSTVDVPYIGSKTCVLKNGTVNINANFSTNDYGVVTYDNVCNILKLSKELVVDNHKKLFGDLNYDLIDFKPVDGKICVFENNAYLCGNIDKVDNITGELIPKFEIIKVEKRSSSIIIYEKGYLQDTRSSVVNPDDGHEKYYLHSSDSNEYYYELKSADNITFAHTFKKNADNYVYEKTEVVK